MSKETKKHKQPEKGLKDIEEEIVVEQENEITVLQNKAEEYLEGWKRCQAEFENYKKRQSESQKDLAKYAAQNVILQILPVLDNFHASTDHIPEDQKNDGWVTGIMYIQKQLEGVLAENGVEEIAPNVGENFDPVFHEAIEDKECMHCEAGKKFENKIKKVLTKGYKMGDRVIRAARVTVE
ncbi:MAG TPA: nucleotide exchange factor GrpE [Patescibacteria group bacterium]